MFISSFIGLASIFIDGILLILIQIFFNETRLQQHLKTIPVLLFGAALYLLSSVMNQAINIYLWADSLIHVIIIVMISRIFIKMPLAKCISLALTSYFFFISIDFTCLLAISFFTSDAAVAAYLDYVLISGGSKEYICYIIISKFLKIIIIFIFIKHKNRIAPFGSNQYMILSALSGSSLFVVFLLLSILFHHHVLATQQALIVSFVSLIVIFFCIPIILIYQNKLITERSEKEELNQLNRILSDNYLEIEKYNDSLREQRHDFKNHLLAIKELDHDSQQDYIDDLVRSNSSARTDFSSGDKILDAILRSKYANMAKKNIRFEYSFNLPSPLSMTPVDISIIFSNLLDNAIEACEKIEVLQERWIVFSIDKKQKMVFFKIENSISRESASKPDPLISDKSDVESHGIGLKNTHLTIQKYNGTLEIDHTDSYFRVQGMINELNSDSYHYY